MYECSLDNGQHLEISTEGAQTSVSLGHRSEGQQQSQGNGFSTGEVTGKPTVERAGQGGYVVRLETKEGERVIEIQGHRMQLLDGEAAKAVTRGETVEVREVPDRERMAPMKPIEPMRPMEPMKPMRPMR